MHKTLIGLIAGSAMLASGAALAQQTPPTPAGTPAQAKTVTIPPGFIKAQAPGQTLARDRLIGAKVHNREGQIIGDIEDLILSSSNQVVGVIMGVGGFLSLGEKRIGIHYGALQFTQKDGVSRIVLPIATKDVLAAVEPYKRSEPPKSLLDRSKEKARELTDRSTETAKDAAEVVKEKAGPAYDKAKEAAGAAVDKAKEAVSPSTPAPAEKK